jgi:hypothetical protein
LTPPVMVRDVGSEKGFMKYNKEAILQDYIHNGIVKGNATLTGDSKTGNRAARIFVTIYKMMEKDSALAEYILNSSFWHQNVNVKSWAAAHALGLNIKKSEALLILNNISGREDIGILQFNAKMTLEVYEKQGFLRFYKEK